MLIHGAVIGAKPDTDRAGRSYWRTIKPVVTSLGLSAAGTEQSGFQPYSL